MQTPSLNSIDTIIGHVRGPKGDPGDTPEITVTDITGGHKVTITVGTAQPIVFNVMDGDDGVSPAVTVADITGGHTVTITDAEHPSGQSFNVMDGVDGTTPAFSIGTVTTGAAGSSAAATITGTAAAPVLNLTIPQGLKGDAGNGDMIADDFSTSMAYAAGDYVIYNGSLYRFTADHAAGAWSGTDATAVQLAEDVSDLKSAINDPVTGLATKAPAIIDTTSGAIASFEDGADGMPLKSLTVNIEPVQDLHGYENPWPAGATKNMLIDEWYPYNIDVDGTEVDSTNNNRIMSGYIPITGGSSYTASTALRPGGTSGDGFGFVEFVYYDSSKTFISIAYANNAWSFTDTAPANAAYMRFGEQTRGLSSTQITSDVYLQYQQQLEAGSTATDYIPYKNICPISGWTGCNVTLAAKNLGHFVDGKTVKANGLIGDADGRVATVDPVVITSAKSYKLVCNDNVSIILAVWNGNTLLRRTIAAWTPGSLLNTSGGTHFYVCCFTSDPLTVDGIEPMVVFADETDLTYAPYQGETYPITFPASAGTVYGGTLDVTSGVLKVTHGITTVSAKTWQYEADNTRFRAGFADMVSGKYGTRMVPLMCSAFQPIDDGRSLVSVPNNSIYGAGRTATVYIKTDTVSTVEDFISVYGDVQILYELATPIDITISPTEITTLLGTNNIWADCGPVSVDYPADTKMYIQKVNKPTDDDMTADTQIASGKYFIVGNNLYLSTTVIPAGDAIIPGTNCTKTDLAAALNALNT